MKTLFDYKKELKIKYPLTWKELKVGHTYIMYDGYWQSESKVFIRFGGWAIYVDKPCNNGEFCYRHDDNYFKEEE